MASYLTQSGTALYTVAHDGDATLINLPTDTGLLGADTPLRFAQFNTPAGSDPVIVCVHGAARDFFIRSTNDVIPLSIVAPTAAPTVGSGTTTGLTGVYMVAVSFKVKDSHGKLIYESGLSPISEGSVALTDDSLLVEDIPIATDAAVNARGLYRTTAGGNILYPWLDIDDNATLSIDRAGADADLSILATDADRNGAPPALKLIAQWGGRLWGVPRSDPDKLRWTEDGRIYGWAADNEVIIPPADTSPDGVVALIPRRDQLGIARKNRLYQITGYDNDTFQRTQLSESLGCRSQESVVVIRDVAYWLGERGVVEWSGEGIGYVSESQIDPWFTTDTYFNRALFHKAQGRYNFETDSYELLLASAGSDALDVWIAFDLKGRRWFGLHETGAFAPTCSGNNTDFHGLLSDENELPITVFGGDDGFIYKRDPAEENDHDTPVEFDIDLPFLHMGEPDHEKYFGELSVHTDVQADGDAIITPYVGNLNATAGVPISHDLTLGRQRLRRLGIGRYLKLNINHAEDGVGFRLFGIEFPWHIVGRR